MSEVQILLITTEGKTEKTGAETDEKGLSHEVYILRVLSNTDIFFLLQ